MTWYSKGDEELILTVEKVMKKFHAPLADALVAIDVLVARNEDGPPVKVYGAEAPASVRITSLRDRAMLQCDAIITIDGESLPSWDSRRLQSVIDGQLRRLSLVVGKKTGKVVRDDLDRPKLKLVPFDHQIAWFDRTAVLFGLDSVEVSQFRSIVEGVDWVQSYLPGFVSEDAA